MHMVLAKAAAALGTRYKTAYTSMYVKGCRLAQGLQARARCSHHDRQSVLDLISYNTKQEKGQRSKGQMIPQMTSIGPDGLIMPAAGMPPIDHNIGNDHGSCKKQYSSRSQTGNREI